MDDNNQASTQQDPSKAPEGIDKAAEKIVTGIDAAQPLIYGTGPKIGAEAGVSKTIGSHNTNQSAPMARSGKTISGKAGAGIGLLIGLTMLVAGYFVLHSGRIPDNYKTATGVIVNGGTDLGKNESESITVKFDDQNGKSHTFNFYTSSTTYRTGDSVQIAYNPSNPDSDARNASDKSGGFIGIVLIGVGGLLSVTMLLAFIRALRRK